MSYWNVSRLGARICPHCLQPPPWLRGFRRRRAVMAARSGRGCLAGRLRFAALAFAAFTARAVGLRAAIATPGSTAHGAAPGWLRRRVCARSCARRAGSFAPLRLGYMGLFAQIAPGVPLRRPRSGRLRAFVRKITGRKIPQRALPISRSRLRRAQSVWGRRKPHRPVSAEGLIPSSITARTGVSVSARCASMVGVS